MPDKRREGAAAMEKKKCLKCGGAEFAEASDFVVVRRTKMSLRGGEKIFTFCVNCGEVASIRIENAEIFKKK